MITLALLAAASPPRHDLAGTARTVRCGRTADADRRLYSVEKQDAARLTDDEMQVLNRIGDAYYAFAALETYHPADHDEFVFHVHAMGRIVMARSAARAHPERNWIKAHTPD
jgi:hypothetical protein